MTPWCSPGSCAASPASAWSTSASEVSRRTPHRSGPEGVGDLDRRPHRVVVEVDEHRDVHLVRVAPGERPRAGHRVASVGGDERVRHRAHAAPAPPRGLGVRAHADRARDVGGPAVPGLHEPVVVAGREEEDLLAPRGADHGVDVAHDQAASGQAAQVDRLQMREQRIVAGDRHDRLARLDAVALVQRPDLELVPARREPTVGPAAPGALLQDRHRLVDAAEDRALLLEDLHEDLRPAPLRLEQVARQVEVLVGVVAGPELVDREAEDARVQAVADGRHRRILGRSGA